MSLALRVVLASSALAGASCAVGAGQESELDATTDADADSDSDADSDGDPIHDPDCGTLIVPGDVAASGHYRLADMCAAADRVNPCARGGGVDFGVRVVPPVRSLVTFSGGVVAGEGYLAVRSDCAAQPTNCIFDLLGDGIDVPLWPNEQVVVHGGSMDDRDCASVSVDLSVWILECGVQAIRLPRVYSTQIVAASDIFRGRDPDELLVVMDGLVARYDLSEPSAPLFGGWHASAAGAERFVSHAVDGDRVYLLAEACTAWDHDRCTDQRRFIEVFDAASLEPVASTPLRGPWFEAIELRGDRLFCVGGGQLLTFAADDLSDMDFSAETGVPAEPVVELSDHEGAMLLATRNNLYGVSGTGSAVGFERLAPVPGGAADIEVRATGSQELVAVAGGTSLELFELRRLDAAPFLELVPLSTSELSAEGSIESVTFVDDTTLALAVSGPVGDRARGHLLVVDISVLETPILTDEHEAYWLPGVYKVLGHPTRPSELLVNEEAGIGVVDLSRCW